MMKVNIDFYAQGDIRQVIELTDPKITAQQLREGLAAGNIYTSITMGEEVLLIEEDGSDRVIGRVVETSAGDNMEYDFSLLEDIDD